MQKQKTMIITSGSQGIGSAVVRTLAPHVTGEVLHVDGGAHE